MMNIGIAAPSRLVSLKAIPGLKEIATLPDGTTRIGAMTSHAALARASLPGAQSILPDTARQIAHPAIRTRGTIGGAVAHADPAADFPAALVAADARIEAVGPQGVRRIAAEDFFVDYLTTALAPGEMIAAILLPPPAPGAAGLYYKFSRVDGDYATLSVAVCLSMAGGTCRAVRLALGSCGAKPVRDPAAEEALAGTSLDDAALARAGVILREACRPEDDVRGSAAYRRAILPGLLARAVRKAAERAG
jgi:carbon-monoxide dehydrogenase medium subunit